MSDNPYFPNTQNQQKEMLDYLGLKCVDDLFEEIPEQYRNPSLDMPMPIGELELKKNIEHISKKNRVPGDYSCFLGAGAYNHFIPSLIKVIVNRGEFLTSYTPYQPEASQGTLQATYEFQSLICQLTGMEVANAGMYDGATALAEAALMACRVNKKYKVAALDTISPIYQEVILTYLKPQGIEFYLTTPESIKLDDSACLIAQYPNYLGCMEDLSSLSRKTHANGGLFIVSVDPIALGMFSPPGDYDADIVTGECQPLGIPLSFGGPYTGLLTCKKQYLRQMPGRIVGCTTDQQNRKGYVLTLQTREQHIRREKATSNICTSESLMSLTAAIYLATLGKRGLRQIAEACYHKSHYTASLIGKIPGYKLPLNSTFFQEFVVECPKSPREINRQLLKAGILGGLDISSVISNGMLFCVTEMNTAEEIHKLVKTLQSI